MSYAHYSAHGETIAAIATPPGEGGVAIIRISGKSALNVAAKIFSGPIHTYKTHTAHYGQVRTLQGDPIDDVLVLVMLGKRSFAGEDTVEIQCHGGALITRRVLEAVLTAGARAALPGEFSFKAFINGKVDLAQAEAIQSLIGAKNERALDAASQQLEGALSKKIKGFQSQLYDTAAILEAWVDFPEEGLEFASTEDVIRQLEHISMEMKRLETTYHDGKIIHEGISLALIGSPNVGKSSLMNTLLQKERAIVSHIPGTTRDVLEDHLRLNGLNFRVLDTAGIREAEDLIEQEGIKRSRKAMEQADLVLLVLDSSRPLLEGEKTLIELLPKARSIVVWNKIDLSAEVPAIEHAAVVKISAKEERGIEELKALIDQVIWDHGPPAKDEMIITNLRHKEALTRAIEYCRNLIVGLETEVSPEFLTLEIRQLLGELGKVVGADVSEDILSAIFSKFCIGK